MARQSPWSAAIVVAAFGIAPTGSGGCGCGDSTSGAGKDDADGDGDASDDNASGGAESDDGDDDDDAPEVSLCRQPTLAVYDGLYRSCVGCHDEGTNVPLAADFVSFELLVAYNTDLVVPGDPGQSRLLAMLEGNAPPPLDQMPPGTVSFAELAESGDTDITMAELESWIEVLEHCDVPGTDLSPRYARRVRAEHIHSMLAAQLDLDPADVEHVSRFPIDDPVFGILSDANNSAIEAWARWAALGGPDYLKGIKRDAGFNPLFFQTVGPTGQAWCARTLELGRGALFPAASSGATDEASVRANIEALYLDMLGIVATADDVDAMFQDVYEPYAAAEDHTVAMKAVCSAFIRHPLWITF